jgi:hypothetical protein
MHLPTLLLNALSVLTAPSLAPRNPQYNGPTITTWGNGQYSPGSGGGGPPGPPGGGPPGPPPTPPAGGHGGPPGGGGPPAYPASPPSYPARPTPPPGQGYPDYGYGAPNGGPPGPPGGGGPPGGPARVGAWDEHNGCNGGGPAWRDGDGWNGPVVVGGSATVVLAPDKTVIVQNPLTTVNAADVDVGSWGRAPDGWYYTSTWECSGGSCAWYAKLRQCSDAVRRRMGWERGLLVWAVVGFVGFVVWA